MLFYRVAKTKALISCAIICVFVFAYAVCWFSYAAAQIILSIVVKEAVV